MCFFIAKKGEKKMREQTELNEVKRIARMLLMTKIHETEYAPAIVQHPFTSTGIWAIPNGDKLRLMNLTKNREDLREWRNHIQEQIDRAETAFEIYSMTNKPYGMCFLKYTMPYLSREEYTKILADAWIRSENLNNDSNLNKKELVAMFQAADPAILMGESEKQQLAELENPVMVYRGVTSYNGRRIKWLSWTLEKSVAEWFAHRFGEGGTVYEVQIKKEHIFALFMGRQEYEVIVNPAHLLNIGEAEEFSMQQTQ